MLYCGSAEIADEPAPQSSLQLCTAAKEDGSEQGDDEACAYNHIRCYMHTHHLPSAQVRTLAKMPTSVVLIPIVQQTSFLNSSMR